MIWIALILMLIGIFLSAFFSGSETGFYRASRVRLVIDGLDGDRISRYLLKLINNPTLFVATTLIGNNFANYLTSMAIVLAVRGIYLGDTGAAEMIAPILMSPLLFVYGELLPKNMFYKAPNRLLRTGAPLFLFFTVLFAPIAAVLWGVGRLVEQLVGESPQQVRLYLARKEVQEVLEEGMQAGILHETQRSLAQNFILAASRPVAEVCIPIARVNSISAKADKNQVLRMAKRRKMSDIPISGKSHSDIVGYVRVVDLLVDDHPEQSVEPPRTLIEIKSTELFGEALIHMQACRETLARVVNAAGKTIGILSIDQLTNPLLKGPLHALRR